ncbi:hypothetical protein [Wolbachia endosymbiont of Ctenocephalides felis wCfeJ]|uniref:hypothetical protein n=1 Tax=Wolbachia endosymbiont of Ctenocephalides felis wCfeJ TaxID=2732594 RepID=UPI00144636E7|nr:hypothetical protein [Wolbachia endosymbiont of Ctenocephalides felis wCfeJ]WCR57605.1 MAG: hypothetical protein PG980_000077 [Wolbachia endosymbiont of Ctenocephalides felis wCfeJ]
MADSFKSSNYNKNLNFLIQVIKLKDTKKIDKQYNETVRDLSQALKNFTNKAEDIAKFVIYTDLNNYVEPVDKKPLGLFGALKEIWLGKDAPVKNDNIRNFAKDKLPNPPLEKAAEYTNILRKINFLKERLDTLKEILDLRRSEKEEHKLHAVNLESVTTSKQRKEEQLKKEAASNRMKKIKRPTMAPPPPPNELKPEPQKKVATTEKKKVRFKSKPEVILFDDSGYGSLSDEESDKKISNYQEKELIYATAPKEHIEAKRANKQQQQSKPTIPPKLPVVPPISKKATDLGQKTKKDKPTIPPKPKNLGLADQQVSMKPRIVGVTPNESKVTPAAQADIGVKKDPTPSPKAASQSHSFPVGNERSEMHPITAKSDPKPSASKQPLIMHVSVKEIAARFESHGKK